MQITHRRRTLQVLLLAGLVIISTASPAIAEPSSSSNYQMVESDFTAGGSVESCAGEYCARVSIGDVSGGTASDGISTAEFGSVTPDEPLLEVIVDPGASDFGILTTDKTATKTTTVRVRSYLSGGYVLQMNGQPPKYRNHTLKSPITPTASQPGKEQFAINVTANTSPAVGATPQQVPSALTSFGTVEPDYNIANMFKYVSGETIARSTKESGRTDYTVSMIVNISNSTPAGKYTGDYSAIVIPVY